MDSAPMLQDMLGQYHDRLVVFFAGEHPMLLRYETAEDLAQHVHLRALEAADSFEFRGEGPLMAWLLQVGRQVAATRMTYWRAVKRDAGTVLRLSGGGGATTAFGIDPTASATGPVTFAQRREMIAIAMDAVRTLSERDRTIVRLGPDASVEEVAELLSLDVSAASRARHRALERFERSFRALAGLA